MAIKPISQNSDIANSIGDDAQLTTPLEEIKNTESAGVAKITDVIESADQSQAPGQPTTRLNTLERLGYIAEEQAQIASDELQKLADDQRKLIDSKSQIRDVQEKIEQMQSELNDATDRGFFDNIASFFGDDQGAGDTKSQQSQIVKFEGPEFNATGQDIGIDELSLNTDGVATARTFLDKASPEIKSLLLDAGQSLSTQLPQMMEAAGGNRQQFLDAVQNHIGQFVQNYVSQGSIADGDIMAVVFIVMMEASKSAREDLKSIMEGVKTINAERQSRLTMAPSADQSEAQTNFKELVSESRLHLGDVFQPAVDAMHGQPQDYDQLQQVVQDLRKLLNSLPIPNAEKLKLQAELDQLDQLSHQIPIQPQNPDQNFAEALQLLQQLRSDLSQYVN